MNDTLTSHIAEIRGSYETHIQLGHRFLATHGSALYPLDFLAVAVVNRSIALIDGFCSLIESANLLAAAPLLRLQVDNCLRFYAAWLVEDPHDFALRVPGGSAVRDLRDASKQRMTDRFLVEKLSAEVPWLERVYQHTSGYVHLSDKHIFSAMSNLNVEHRSIDMWLGRGPGPPQDLLIEACEAFKAATWLLLRYLAGWAESRSAPERLRRPAE
jgi:hypothetical protein